MRIGARVTGIALGEGRKRHELTVETPAGSERVRPRWVIDAAGRQGTLARQLGLRVPEPQHLIGSVWGRFEGLADVDQLGDDAFHGRVRHTTRGLSTIHFLNPGYWVWLIRLRGGVTSVGVVGTPARDRALRTPEGFRAFLDEHARAARDPRRREGDRSRQLRADRLRHEALPRPRALGARRRGRDRHRPALQPRARLRRARVRLHHRRRSRARRTASRPTRSRSGSTSTTASSSFRHEAVMRLYRGLYGMIGSYELMRLKWDFDIASYHNLWVAPFMTDQHLDADWLRRQLRLRNLVLRAMDNFAALFGRAEESLRERGAYYRTQPRRVLLRAREHRLPAADRPAALAAARRSSRPSARSTSCGATRSRCSARTPASRLAAAVVRDALACLSASAKPPRIKPPPALVTAVGVGALLATVLSARGRARARGVGRARAWRSALLALGLASLVAWRRVAASAGVPLYQRAALLVLPALAVATRRRAATCASCPRRSRR